MALLEPIRMPAFVAARLDRTAGGDRRCRRARRWRSSSWSRRMLPGQAADAWEDFKEPGREQEVS